MKKANQACGTVCPIPPLEIGVHLEMAALTRQKVEVRAQKVQHLKQQIAAGTYDVSAAEVVRGIVRSEILRLLTMARARSHGM
ncbi:MAG: flagellar biosynthesis anti-sigma factor FlgM [Deltaproteobacteria bacterium]|nr:flagellar biosynthesis anti-sigma factor FlgM [Deltaproteobacteria bacterium]